MEELIDFDKYPPLAQIHVNKFRQLVHSSEFVWQKIRDEFSTYARRQKIPMKSAHPLTSADCSVSTCRLFWSYLYKLEFGSDTDDDSDFLSDSDEADNEEEAEHIVEELGNNFTQNNNENQLNSTHAAIVFDRSVKPLVVQEQPLEKNMPTEPTLTTDINENIQCKDISNNRLLSSQEERKITKLSFQDQPTVAKHPTVAKMSLRSENVEENDVASSVDQSRTANAPRQKSCTAVELANAIQATEGEQDMSSTNLLYKINYDYQAHKLAMIDAQTPIFEELSEGLDLENQDEGNLVRSSTKILAKDALKPSLSASERRSKIHKAVTDHLKRDELFPPREVYEERERLFEARRKRFV